MLERARAAAVLRLYTWIGDTAHTRARMCDSIRRLESVALYRGALLSSSSSRSRNRRVGTTLERVRNSFPAETPGWRHGARGATRVKIRTVTCAGGFNS